MTKGVVAWVNILVAFLVLAGAVSLAGAQDRPASPVISDLEPRFACAGCAVGISGFGLSSSERRIVRDIRGERVDPTPPPSVLLVRDGEVLTATVNSWGGGVVDLTSRIWRDRLVIEIPATAAPGAWQVVVEHKGQRSAPATIEIGEWVPPTLHAITPGAASPGQLVTLAGGSFPTRIVVELADSAGRMVDRTEASARPGEARFMIPQRLPEGQFLLRVGTRRNGGEWFSDALPLVVTLVPATPSLSTHMMTPVAPGQWTEAVFELDSVPMEPEQVDLEFRQGAVTAVAQTRQARSLKLQVPPTLSPGTVTIRARIWRSGRASAWSEPAVYDVEASRITPSIEHVIVERDGGLVSGLEKPTSSAVVEVRAGDVLMLAGRFPIEGVRALSISFVGSGGTIPVEGEDFKDHIIRLFVPPVRPGTWTLSVLPADGRVDEAPPPLTLRVIP